MNACNDGLGGCLRVVLHDLFIGKDNVVAQLTDMSTTCLERVRIIRVSGYFTPPWPLNYFIQI